MKTRMNIKLLIGLALALVLVSGAFIHANAVGISTQPQARASACVGNCAAIQPPAQAACQDPYRFGPITPMPFGSVGGAGGG